MVLVGLEEMMKREVEIAFGWNACGGYVVVNGRRSGFLIFLFG